MTGEQVDTGEGDEELDAALEVELAASFVKHPLASELSTKLSVRIYANKIPHMNKEVQHSSWPISGAVHIQNPTSYLSFSFPGWAIDISKESKRRKSSISRHTENLNTVSKRKPAVSFEESTSTSKCRAWECPDGPGEGCPVDNVDDDLLVSIFKRLATRDLCASMRTSKRWHRVGCREDVWEHMSLAVYRPQALPRWMQIRNDALLKQIQFRYFVFSKGYEFVRHALNGWWDSGKPDSKYPSAVFHSLIQKLVIYDWSLLYETFGAAFSDRADHIATTILTEIEITRLSRMSRKKVEDEEELLGGESVKTSSTKVTYPIDGENRLDKLLVSKKEGGGSSIRTWDELRGEEIEVQEIWELVLSLWRRFKQWLMLVVSHCPELNHEVRVERSRGFAFTSTPTVYDKGVISFRSQVILKYGIRSALQVLCTVLVNAKRSSSASDSQLVLLRSAYNLFQEINVPDDLTLPSATFTQQKLRRCFRNDTSFRI